MLLVLRMRELHELIGIYDTIPDAGLKGSAPDPDPARTRFLSALTVVAKLEAQSIASTMGLAEVPDVPAFAGPVIRLLELPFTTTRDWTGWYRIPEAGIELIAGLVPLAYRCGGDAQLERLLAQFNEPGTTRTGRPTGQHVDVSRLFVPQPPTTKPPTGAAPNSTLQRHSWSTRATPTVELHLGSISPKHEPTWQTTTLPCRRRTRPPRRMGPGNTTRTTNLCPGCPG